MVKDKVLKMSSSLLNEIKNMGLNTQYGNMCEAYDNYKNTIELYLNLESELPKSHSILANAKKAISKYTPMMEKFLKSDNEVMSMISEASKAEIEAKKAEEAAKKNELKLIKELKTELKNDYKTIKSIVDGINTSIAAPNFKLTRWHINEMILMCNEMKTKINALIEEETQNVSDTQEDNI